jgi:hypothetical protein
MFLQQHIAQGGELDKFRQLARDLGHALRYHLYDPVAWATPIGFFSSGWSSARAGSADGRRGYLG